MIGVIFISFYTFYHLLNLLFSVNSKPKAAIPVIEKEKEKDSGSSLAALLEEERELRSFDFPPDKT